VTATNCLLPHREPREALPSALVCRHHHGWLRDSIDDIVCTYALLPHFYEPGTAVDDGHQVKGKRVDPPAPVRLDVVALLDKRTVHRYQGDIVPVLAILEAWARLVREERRLQACQKRATVTSEAGLLLGHLDWIIAQPFVDELAREIREVKSALHSAIGDHAPRPVGTCHVVHPDEDTECGGRLYQDRYGGMSVTCRKCGETWGETELRRLGLMTQAI
jgi:hypothetical protein